jgi:DNA end-binding protein Ku
MSDKTQANILERLHRMEGYVMRSMWKGNVSFGMVNIPVRLYKATDDSSSTALCNIHKECGTAVKEPKYCPKCQTVINTPDGKQITTIQGKILESSELQKAYPLDRKKENCIPLTEEELSGLPLQSLHAIQVDGFITSLPDKRYADTFYVLEPDETGVRAFALFEQALRDTGKLGVAKITTASKEHLCVIGSNNDGLMYLQTIHWTSELRDTSELKRPTITVSEKELAMAKMLLGTMTQDIDLTVYRNEYGDALKQLIKNKQEGITLTAPEKPAVKELDLVDQLMASLKAVGASV